MKNKQKLLMIGLLICFVLSLSVVSAADSAANAGLTADNDNQSSLQATEAISLQQTNDIEVLTAGATLNFTALDAKINNASDTSSIIYLNDDYAYDSSYDANFIDGIAVKKDNIIIDGQGHTISGSDIARIFNIGYAVGGGSSTAVNNVILRNITFVHAYNPNDNTHTAFGAVQFYGNGAIEHCNFYYNNAICAGALALGGSSSMTISNCTFEHNNASANGGGAIRFRTVVTNVDIMDSIFRYNYAKTDGGAIHWAANSGNDNNEVFNCTFVNNTADRYGGAMLFASSNDLINKSRFINNTAATSGGAIYWQGSSGNITNSNFTHNNATEGGAILWNNANGVLYNCNFTSNEADTRGGAVLLKDSHHASFDWCTFTGNVAGTNGGALEWPAGSSYGNVSHSSFIGNIANRSGGAVYWNGEHGTIEHSNFTNNSALGIALATNAFGEDTYGGDGGAVIWIGSHGSVDDCRFIDNNATKRGGAVYLQGTSTENCTDTNFTNSYFEHNYAGTNGGAIDWNVGARNGLVDTVTFVNNTAKRSGGAIYWRGHNGTIEHSNFTENHALGNASGETPTGEITMGGDGGAVMWTGALGNITDCRFTKNDAVKRGGAVFLQSGIYESCDNVTFDWCTFKENVAGTNGGAIDFRAGAEHGKVFNSVFEDNIANRSGGAIYWSGHNGTIEHTNFTHNKALGIAEGEMPNGTVTLGGDAGALMWTGAVGLVNDCWFINNTALKQGGAVFLQAGATEVCSDTTFNNSHFINNSAAYGGAIYYNKGAIEGKIILCEFISNNVTEDGAAVLIQGTYCEIHNTTFKNNTAGDDGGAIDWRGDFGTIYNITCYNNKGISYGDSSSNGGTISLEGSNVTIKKSTFEMSSATVAGGAIFVTGNYVNITDSSFLRCNVSMSIADTGKTYDNGGGAIFLLGNYSRIINCDFEQSKAREGGVVYVQGHDVTISNLVSNRTSALNGGSIYVLGDNTIISESNISYSNATLSGGAVYVKGSSTIIDDLTADTTYAKGSVNDGGGAIYVAGDETEIRNSEFTHNFANNNHAARGGALYITGEDTLVYNTNFENSGSNLYGGFIYIKGENTTIEKSNFTNSSVGSDYSGGGAIYINGSNASVKTSIFKDLTSYYGGAIYIAGDDADVIGSNFSNINSTKDGGVIYVAGNRTSIVESNFNSTKSSDRGGAIFVAGTNTTISASIFFNDNATGNGGAVYVTGKNTNISGSSFDNCVANEGGAICLTGENTTIEYSNITNCKATINGVSVNDGGGGIYMGAKSTTIKYSNFENNSCINSGSKGGAILWYGGSTGDSIIGCNFTGNNATSLGGAVYWSTGDGTTEGNRIVDSRFVRNHADSHGGALDWYSSNNGIIDNCEFINNTAGSLGGAIYSGQDNHWDNRNLTISNSKFYNNSANVGGAISNQMGYSHIVNNTFDGNKAIRGSAGTINMANVVAQYTEIVGCNFTNSVSVDGGGTIFLNVQFITIKDCDIRNAYMTNPTRHGAGIFLNGNAKNATIDGCNFTNLTGKDGGAIYVGAEGLLINNSKFVECIATEHGGAVWVSATNTIINNTNFIANQATGNNGEGGAIRWISSKGILSNSNFTNNTAKNGGAILWFGSNGKLMSSSFTSNNATGYGGAVSWSGSGGSIDKSNFTSNNAEYGGAVSWSTSGNITNSIFRNNTALTGNARGGAIYWATNSYLINSTLEYNKAGTGSAIWAQSNFDIVNTTLLDNRANIKSFADTSVTRTGNTITVKSYLRGNDDILNAIYSNYKTVYFTNVTFLGVNGTDSNTGQTRKTPLRQRATDENDFYVTDYEVNQLVYASIYNKDTNELLYYDELYTDYLGGVSITFDGGSLAANNMAVKLIHPLDDYYTYLAYANGKKLADIGIPTYDIHYLEHESFVINVTSASDSNVPTGNISLKVINTETGEVVYTANNLELSSGKTGTITLPVLTVGTYKVIANYTGDTIFLPENASATFKVLKIPSDIKVEIDNYNYSKEGKAVITITTGEANNITIKINDQTYTVEINDTLTKEFEIPFLNAGNYTADVVYPTTHNYLKSSNSTDFTVYKIKTEINVTGEYTPNKEAVITVDLGPLTVTGEVYVEFNGKNYTLPIINSQIVLTVEDVPLGMYDIYVEYGGDRNHYESNNTAQLDATKYKTTLNIDVTNITYEDNETIIFTLTEGVTGNLTITFNGRTWNETINPNGTVILKYPGLVVGNYTVSASYAGDDSHIPVSNSTWFIVSRAPSSIDPRVENITYLETEHLIAYINQTGNVTITIRSLENPNQIIKINPEIIIENKNVGWNISDLNAGNYIAQFTFNGNDNYLTCEVNKTFKVKQANVTIIVEVDNIKVGKNATVNVTVNPTGNVTGNVTIFVDGENIGDYVLTDGFVQLTNVSGLINGTHDVVAVYNGDINFIFNKNSTRFNVAKHTPNFNITGKTIYIDQNGFVNVTLPVNATGMVYLDVNGTPYFINLTNSRNITLPILTKADNYTVYGTYSGDDYWESIGNETWFMVYKLALNIDVEVKNMTYGETQQINITGFDDATGTATIKINDTKYVFENVPIVNGVASVTTPIMPSENYTVEVIYVGDRKYNATASSKNFTVNRSSSAPISITTQNITYTQTEYIVVYMDADGTITLKINNTQYGDPKELDHGQATFDISYLTAGNYTAEAIYSGNTNYYSKSIKSNFTVSRLIPNMTLNVSDIPWGSVEYINVTVNATGNVTIFVDGRNRTIILEEGEGGHAILRAIINSIPEFDGKAKLDVYDLAVGTYPVTVVYNGNENYETRTIEKSFEVYQIDTPLKVNVTDIPVWSKEIINITVHRNATGEILVYVDGNKTPIRAPITNGTAQVNLTNLAKGPHVVWVFYDGDKNFTANRTSETFNVTLRTPTITVNTTNITVGKTEYINVTIPANATGHMVISGNCTDHPIYIDTIIQGNATLPLTDLKEGNYTVHVYYSGDGNYTSATKDASFTVSKLNTTLTIDVNSTTYDNKVNITVEVDNGVEGNITIYLNTTDLGTYRIVGGKVNITIPNPGAQNYTVYAIYNGNYKYNVNNTESKDFKVSKAAPTITIDKVTVDANNSAVIKVHINDTATGKMNITVNRQNYTADIIDGVATFNNVPVLPVGEYDITANYYALTDTNYTIGSATLAKGLNVTKVASYPMNVTARDVAVEVNTTITVNVPGDATGSVTIWVNGTPMTKDVSEGKAIFSLNKTAEGKYSVNATLSDDKYGNQTVYTTYCVYKVDTPIVIESITGSLNVDGTATVTVTVPEDVKNNVTIEINGKSYNNTQRSGNTFTFTVPDLTYGNKTVVAIYGGDNKYRYNSTTRNFTVGKVDVKVNITVKNITYGDKVNITVNVTDKVDGFITISINDTLNRTLPVKDGVVNWIVDGLAAGNYTIHAIYEGNDKFNVNDTEFKDFEVAKATPVITIDPVEVDANNSAVITVRINDTATGTMNITVNKHNYTADIIDGVAIFDNVPVLPVGIYNITANYYALTDKNYTEGSGYIEIGVNVTKVASYPMNVTARDVAVEVNTTITVNVPGDATGSVTIWVNGTPMTKDVSEGKAIFSLNKTSEGKYSVNATLNDNKYGNQTVYTTYCVYKVDTPLSIDVGEPVYANDTVTVTVTVPEGIKEIVTIEINGETYYNKSVDGNKVIFEVPNITYGNKTVVAKYGGDNRYRANSTTEKFTVNKRASFITVDATNTVVDGESVINVTVPDKATGIVVVNINGTNYTINLTNTDRVAVKVTKAGTYNVTVTYSGDDQYLSETNKTSFTVSKLPSAVDVKVSNITVGDVAAVNITVTTGAGGNVTITIGDEYNKTVGVTDGVFSIIVPGLTVGNKTVNVTYNGNYKYLSNRTSADFTVGKINETGIKVIDQGNSTVVIVVGDNATGNVIIKEGNNTYFANVTNGTAVITLVNSTPGEHNITVIYSGDDTHSNSTVNDTVTIPRYDTEIKVNVTEITEGDVALFNVTVPENATGNVTVIVDGKEYPGTIVNGTAIVPVDNLTAGDKTFVVVYPGDGNYSANFTVGNLTVREGKSTPDLVVIDQGNGTVIIVVGDNAAGNVTVKVGNDTYVANVTGGIAVVDLVNTTPGTYNATVDYSGDDTHNNATVNATVTVKEVIPDKKDTPINVNVSGITEGEPALFNVTVPRNATGNVTVIVDGNEYQGTIVNGTVVVPVDNLTAGDKTFVVVYPGDGNYSANFTVGNLTVREGKSTPDLVVIDQGNGTVVVVVGDNAAGNVTVKVGNDTYVANVTGGIAVVDLVNTTPGTYNATVDYSGDDTHKNATVNATVTIEDVVPTKKDAPIYVNVTDITEDGSAVVNVTVPRNATGNVTVFVDGKAYPGTIINGTAIVPVENLTAGPKTIVVVYSGDGNYSANFTVGNFTVKDAKSTPEIIVVDPGNGTVVVIVGDNATGNVTVKVGNETYVANVTGGVAYVDLVNATPGTHNVTVIYSGDDTHNNATVNSTSTVPKYDSEIRVNVTEITEGEPAIITVTVPKNATGNVTVIIDGKEYPGAIDNGTAVIPIDGLTAGNKTFVVIYHGDGNYSANYTVGNMTVKEGKTDPDIKVIDHGNGTVVVVVGDNATGNVTVKVGNETYIADVTNGTAIINLVNNTPGTYDITVDYSGDDTHKNTTVNATITIREVIPTKQDTPIYVDVEDIKVGDNATVIVHVPENASGNITIEINGISQTQPIVDGTARFTVENLTAGYKTVAVSYLGDDGYAANFTTAQFNVTKHDSFVDATITDIDVGDNVTITVTVPEDATGQVLIDIDGVGYYVNVTGGSGTIEIPRIPSGIYHVNMTYVGDDKYLPSYNTGVFNVTKVKSFVIPIAQDIYVGEVETIIVHVPLDATGTVTLVIGGEEYNFSLNGGKLGAVYNEGKQYPVAVSGGNGELVITGLPKGEYTVSARYNGDAKYLPCDNFTTFKVLKKEAGMEIIDQGNGTVIISIGDNATGNVTVKVGNETYVTDVVNGTATIDLVNNTPGTYDITVDYSGDDKHDPSTGDGTVTIPKYNTPISVDVYDINVGDSEIVTVHVPAGAAGLVTIEINGKEYNATIKNDEAVFNVTGLAFGEKTVAVKYHGDDKYVENSTTGQFTVSKVPSTVNATARDIKVGDDEVITATVPGDATGRVLVDINGVGYYGTIINGKAKIIIPELPSGEYTAYVTYEGDDKYLPSTNTVLFTVTKVKAPIKAEGETIKYGDDATVVVHVPEDATGTVTIVIDGKTYTEDVDDGKAVFVIPGLTPGDHDVTANYSGDRKYEANDTITDVDVVYHNKTDDGNKTIKPVNGVNLEEYPTGNPLFVLLAVLLAIGSTQLRRFKK